MQQMGIAVGFIKIRIINIIGLSNYSPVSWTGTHIHKEFKTTKLAMLYVTKTNKNNY